MLPDPARATAIAQEYTAELNRVVNQMSTSSAHREREFLEERLKAVQLDLADAEKQFSQFASKSGAIDIQAQGRAMIGAAAQIGPGTYQTLAAPALRKNRCDSAAIARSIATLSALR